MKAGEQTRGYEKKKKTFERLFHTKFPNLQTDSTSRSLAFERNAQRRWKMNNCETQRCTNVVECFIYFMIQKRPYSCRIERKIYTIMSVMGRRDADMQHVKTSTKKERMNSECSEHTNAHNKESRIFGGSMNHRPKLCIRRADKKQKSCCVWTASTRCAAAVDLHFFFIYLYITYYVVSLCFGLLRARHWNLEMPTDERRLRWWLPNESPFRLNSDALKHENKYDRIGWRFATNGGLPQARSPL